MNIADKIIKFDNMLDNSLQSFEELFQIKVDSVQEKRDIVEILEPCFGSLRKILINNNPYLVDLEPTVDGRSKADLFFGGRKFYKYIANNTKGEVLAEAYSIDEMALKLNTCKATILNIMKRKNEIVDNTGGRQRKDILIKRIELDKKEDRKLVTKNKKRNIYTISKDGKIVAEFTGLTETANFLNVSKASIALYSQGIVKNKKGFKVEKRQVL